MAFQYLIVITGGGLLPTTMPEASFICAITEDDKKTLYDIYNIDKNKIFVVRPFFPYTRIKTDYYPRKQLVITGSMNWYPNIEGVVWFAKEVFPYIIHEDPKYKLFLVGRKPDKRILELASSNIVVTGEVQSVNQFLNDSDLLIVPNRLGGGAKIKILEGGMKGIPIVSLRHSIVGYESYFTDKDFVVDDFVEGSVFANRILQINSNFGKKTRFISSFMKQVATECALDNFVKFINN